MHSKIDLTWTILCQGSSIDKESNNLSLFKIIEDFKITLKKPALEEVKKGGFLFSFPLEIVSLWTRKKEGNLNFEAILEIIDPNGNKLDQKELPLEIGKQFKRLRSRINMPGLKITKEGTYQFVLQVKEKKEKKYIVAGKFPLDVSFSITK